MSDTFTIEESFLFMKARDQGKVYINYLVMKRDEMLSELVGAADDVELRKLAGSISFIQELLDDIEQAQPGGTP